MILAFYHVTLKNNLSSILLSGLFPQVGERSAKYKDPRVLIFSNKIALEDAIMSWLDEEFSEEEELVLLGIQLPVNFPLESEVPYEVISRQIIDSKYIKLFEDMNNV
ncbi:hypothetical protein U8V72_26760 [Priestia filamentosa]|uniref:hypothetical protein n=1 Tax=Priestia filamentosa TaxID=1402861 RepID=UPI00397CC5F3